MHIAVVPNFFETITRKPAQDIIKYPYPISVPGQRIICNIGLSVTATQLDWFMELQWWIYVLCKETFNYAYVLYIQYATAKSLNQMKNLYIYT
jgi:hypothetical protein